MRFLRGYLLARARSSSAGRRSMKLPSRTRSTSLSSASARAASAHLLGSSPFQSGIRQLSSGVTRTRVSATPYISNGRDAVELASFLHWGGAVWRPRGYHYALPSGRHAKTFVRPADAFVDIRAAAALSTWLRRWVQLDTTTAVIADSGTLGPIVTELRAAADRAEGARIGPVLGIDTYPPSPFGLPAHLLKATDGQPILGLVSVSDTGRLARELREMLRGGGATDYHIEQLVTRGPNEESGLPPGGVRSGVLAPWLALADGGSQPAAPRCEACDDPSSARIVRINPRSMSAMLLPEPTLLMLDLTDARRNAVIWQEYQKVKAPESWISFVGPIGTRKPGDTLESDRDSIFFEPAALVRGHSAPELLRRRRNKLDNLPRRQGKDSEWRRIRDAKEAVGDMARVVVIDGDERRLFNDGEWARFRLALGPFLSEAAVFAQHETSDAGEPTLKPMPGEELPSEPTNVLIVALGLRTGVTLHRMFLTARQRWPRASHRGLVIHAHPDDDRIWASARNTFTDSKGVSRLVALWLTYVPRRSPLAEEAKLLLDIPAADIADEDVRAVLVRRTQMLKPTGRPDNPLWGPLHGKVEGSVISWRKAWRCANPRRRGGGPTIGPDTGPPGR